MEYEPFIVGFCCWHCSYAAADLAGTSHIEYPTNIRIVRVPCSATVSLAFMLRAFEMGADGVFVAGCEKGGCHYVDGNYKAEKNVIFCKRLLEHLGLGSERLEMYFMGAPDAEKFAEAAKDITQRAKRMGPSPLRGRIAPKRVWGKKRELLRSQIMFIAKELGREFEKPLIIPDVIEGFGFPRVDPEKCTGCGACASVCMDKATLLEDLEAVRQIGHVHWRCVACSRCVDACQEKAIEVIKGFDLTEFLQDRVKINVILKLARCEMCGRPIGPLPQLNKAAMLLPQTYDYIRLCDLCRVRETVISYNLGRAKL